MFPFFIIFCLLLVILLVIIFLSLKNSVSLYSITPHSKKIKFAICTQTRNPVDIDYWLHYYFDHLQVDRIYLKIENTPGLLTRLKKNIYFERMIVEERNHVSNRDTYDHQQQRQCEWVNYSIKHSRDDGFDYLLHVDDDELLILSKKYTSLSDFLNKNDFSKHSNIHLHNAEAVYGEARDKKDECFLKPTKINPCNISGTCRSYANGKSFGNLHFKDLSCLGCHAFSGKTHHLAIEDSFILHFDSCTFSKWFDKFSNLSNISNRVFEKIPFSFYKDSIKNIQNCPAINEECKSQVYNYYSDFMTKIPERSKTIKEMNIDDF
jgi:hypothetical protein